ncbi:hypothetical protein ACJX0J_042191, partial [Zea mays]
MARDPASSLLACCCAVPRLPPCLRAAAPCPVGACYVLDEMRSKPRAVDFLQQPRRLRALRARCFIKRSEQHAVDTRRVFVVLRNPIRDAVENH